MDHTDDLDNGSFSDLLFMGVYWNEIFMSEYFKVYLKAPWWNE